MTPERKKEILESVADYFPPKIKIMLRELPPKSIAGLNEIRLRAGRPLSLNIGGENVFLSANGEICHLMQQGLYTVGIEEVNETFRSMCDCSVYAHSEQIRAGYITLKNGCRAGIAASAVYENGSLTGFTAVSSINVRLSAEYIGCAAAAAKYLDGGMVIAGPPASGKTTMLRDTIRMISSGTGTARKRVAVIDSRGEIAAVTSGIPQNDVGPLTDVITGCEKAEGVEIALRTLNPQVIAFDEIGSFEETNALMKGFFAGADIITTVHAGSIEELKHRDAVSRILLEGAVKRVMFIPYAGAQASFYNVSPENHDFSLLPVHRGVVGA